MVCPHKGKADFLAEIYDYLTGTQSFIFVNTRDFVVPLQKILKKKGLNPTVMFGEMTAEERDEMMEKFRNRDVNVFITTNMMARGIDVPSCEFVVNYDVPTYKEKG